jgi:hypothetical protein
LQIAGAGTCCRLAVAVATFKTVSATSVALQIHVVTTRSIMTFLVADLSKLTFPAICYSLDFSDFSIYVLVHNNIHEFLKIKQSTTETEK